MNEEKKTNLIGFAIILSIGLIITGLILANTWRKNTRANVTITVTGSAQKDIRSDLAVWEGSFSNEAQSLSDAYSKLQGSYEKVKNYLIAKGFSPNQLVFSSINTSYIKKKNPQGYDTDEISAYRLSQSVTIESNDVDKIDILSREATELINQGVEFNSHPPQFFYTKLADLKIEMIGLASKDAKARAEQIAKSTDNEIDEVRSSRMGVIQITAKHSTEISDYGIYDTSSLEKTITVVVTMSFTID